MSLRNSFLYLVGFSENDPNFSSIWLVSDNESGTWTRVGPSGPATSLRGHKCWVCDCVAGGREAGRGNWRNVVVGLGETQETFQSQYVSSVRGKAGFDDVTSREGLNHRVELWGCRRSWLAVS